MSEIRLIEKKRYVLSTIIGHYGKEEIAAAGKEARKLGLSKGKPVVIDFRQAELEFHHQDVLEFFQKHYQKSEHLLKLVYVAHWFKADSPYLQEIDQEWLNKGISTYPFSEARDIIHWVNEIDHLKKHD